MNQPTGGADLAPQSDPKSIRSGHMNDYDRASIVLDRLQTVAVLIGEPKLDCSDIDAQLRGPLGELLQSFRQDLAWHLRDMDEKFRAMWELVTRSAS